MYAVCKDPLLLSSLASKNLNVRRKPCGTMITVCKRIFFHLAGKGTMIRMLKTQPVRSALFLGCGMQLFQQLCGINTVMYV